MDTLKVKSLKDNMEKEKDTSQNNLGHKGQNIPLEQGKSSLPAPEYFRENKAETVKSGGIGISIARAEKIVAATYMVTSFLPDSDSLKAEIRGRSTNLLSDFYSSRTASFYERAIHYEKIAGATRDIIGFLFIAFSVNFVSEMNYSILKKEYELLAEKLEFSDELRTIRRNTRPLTNDFFTADEEGFSLFSDAGTGNKNKDIYKGQDNIKDKENDIPSFIKKEQKFSIKTLKDNGYKKKDIFSTDLKNERKDNILKIIRKKGDVTIKDISSVISGCSEKTIQRELLVLVSLGVLKKEGEKRWSKYSLV